MESLLGALAVFGIFIFVIAIVIYVAEAIFLNKFNKLVNGKGTVLAWIPICNIYLLGKLTINKFVGWVLVVCILITGTYTTTINGVKITHTILPEEISSVVSTLYNIAVLVLFIYAIVKYFKIKKNGNNHSIQDSQQATNQYQQQSNNILNGNIAPTSLQNEMSNNQNIAQMQQQSNSFTQPNPDNTGSMSSTVADSTPNNTGSMNSTVANSTTNNTGSMSSTVADATSNNTGSMSSTVADATSNNTDSMSSTVADSATNNTGSMNSTVADSTANNTGSMNSTVANSTPNNTGSMNSTVADSTPVNQQINTQ